MSDKCQNCGLYKTRCLNAEAKVEVLEKAISEKNLKLRYQRAAGFADIEEPPGERNCF